MMQSSFSGYPSANFQEAVPNNATNQPSVIRAVYCLTSGNLVVHNGAGTSVTIPMTAGQSLAIAPKRILTTSTGTYLLLR